MVEPAFEESIGFVARAMMNFGLTDLHIVKPAATLGDNGRMRGGHAQDILESIVFHDSLRESLDGLDLTVGTTAHRSYSATNLLRKPLTPRELGGVLQGASGNVGMVLGREGTGLNNHELSQCDITATIAAATAYETLNLSHAAAILFYELYHSSLSETGNELATENVKRTILENFSETLTAAGLESYKIGLTIRALRNVLGRSAVRRREGSLLAGAMRQMSSAIVNGLEKRDIVPRLSQVMLRLEE